MWIRIIGCLLIIILSWLVGFILSKTYSDRVEQLKELDKLFNAIYNQISYTLVPIPDVINSIKKDIKSPLNIFLDDFLKNILSRTMDISNAWNKALEMNQSKLCLSNEDFSILKWFGNQLVYSDKTSQLRNIQFTIEQLHKNSEEAEIRKEKNCKLYRSLGISVGLFIAILLV